MGAEIKLGANFISEWKCQFRVWAPFVQKVEVRLVSPEPSLHGLEKEERGYFSAVINDVKPGTRYFYRLDEEKERPDPASHYQPDGVHLASAAVADHFLWEDEHWSGVPLREMVAYELHVGAFTPEGTFDAVVPRLAQLRELGVNAIEIMPVAQFPGDRNWGYDGVHPFAVQNSYGGPEAFRRLINQCHKYGMAVILDVVYNHLGPEGNHLRDFGPYFTTKYKTPWGEALNFDGAYSDEVREFFIQNALYWLEAYHIDALRLDAVHAIYDQSAIPFLQQLAATVEAFWQGKTWQRYLIAESDLNDSRLIRPRKAWGCGLDAQWLDDFHHSVHALLTNENDGYYQDFGSLQHLIKAFSTGYVYSGEFSPYRNRRHGNISSDLPAEQFMVATQNHDQVGNRLFGERLSVLVPYEVQKIAAALLLLSPYVPLLFMGQEYGEDAPFLYFISHQDRDLVEAVRAGRSEEFRAFGWTREPPDPVSTETFLRSKLDWPKRDEGKYRVLLDFHRTLIQMRRQNPAFMACERDHLELQGMNDQKILLMRRWCEESETLTLFNLSLQDVRLRTGLLPCGIWNKLLDSSEESWMGPGSLLPAQLSGGETITLRAQSVVVCSRSRE